ncbi:MAG TPA: lamin tail domain-containing protein, partial [Verrucomicrobiota bacterium]|nr:lamin tail domain-containing protein [Verrucomicrobiota bacterium]
MKTNLLSSLLLILLVASISEVQGAPTLLHRYSFDTDARDSAGTAHGTLMGGAVVSGGAVVLDGFSGFVDLPNEIVSSLSSVTFEVWLTDFGSGTWSRIFDFGFSTAGEGNAGTGFSYLFVCPQNGGGVLRAAITPGSNAEEQVIDWPGTRLPVGELTHVVWTIDSATQTGVLYVNGAPVGVNPFMTYTPQDLGFTDNNWIGRSQFSSDAYLSASITEFRIYDGALTAEEVAQSYLYGPDAPLTGPVEITVHPQSQSVMEGRPVTFFVEYGGTTPVYVQWYRNGVAIPGANQDAYTIDFVSLTNHNASFHAILTNIVSGTIHTATSSVALLTVTPDVTPPELVSAFSLFPDGVSIQFSEAVRPDTATNIANYAITGGGTSLQIFSATFGQSASNIILTTAPQLQGAIYTVTVSGVRDLASAANLIAPGSQTTFTSSQYISTDIGNPSPEGHFDVTGASYQISSAGRGIGGTADQFTFVYLNYTNNFDVQVKVGALGTANPWARAGLMARAGFASNAVFAATLASPGMAGCQFLSRANTGGTASAFGAFPVNYPDTWLRLRRTGDLFEGLASLDGLQWERVGSATLVMPSIVQVGFALASGEAGNVVAAEFGNAGNGSGTILSSVSLPFEPLGPSSRRTALVISEIMYNPLNTLEGTNDLEFIELWNSGLVTEDLTGHRIGGEVNYTFPDGTKIAPGEFLVVAKDPAAMQAVYGVTCLGPYENKLSNNGGTIQLINELGGILLEVEYDEKHPWPAAANGAGHSLVLSRPSYGENDPRAWSASDVIGGSPGAFEHAGSEPARGVVINEFLANPVSSQQDFIELFNTRLEPVNLSGAWLTDSAGELKFRIPDGTVIPARGWLSWTQSQLGFGLAAEGEQIFLVNSNRTRVLDAVVFDAQADGVSTGRSPDGAPGFQELAAITPGGANSAPLIRSVVINEIMYHPISGLDDDEYVELHNHGIGAVDISGWRIQGGIDFIFPEGTLLAPGGYVVAAKNAANLIAKYPQLNATNTFGNYSGTLRNSGERIQLAMPDLSVSGGITNVYYIVVDEVTYFDGGRWGKWSDGGGSSLELIDPRADNREPMNWADSDESGKAPWTLIDVTDFLENGQSASIVHEGNNSYGIANRFEFFLQGPGEALVDNIEFRHNGGTNLVVNGTFESGNTGWTFGGVLRNSFVETGTGVGGTRALHLVAADRGDTGPNKVWRSINTVATGGQNTGTIRAAVRWLKGSPYILFRLRGNWIEASQRLNVPTTCGTPGLVNSRRVPNAGPAISGVTHSPVLPPANTPVVVTARVADPDGVSSVTLRYRIDPAMTYVSVPMLDNGTGADAVAGDGIYSAQIPGQPAATLVAFSISAMDAAGTPAASQFPSDAPARECLVRFGETLIGGTLGTYRLWLTSSNINFWTARERNANDPIDATFVYGNSRVVYNVGTLYSGSPFHTPSYNGPLNQIASDYEVNFPPDERFLGSEPFVLTAYDVDSGNFFFNDDSAQVDLTGNWIARKLRQPYNYRRHVHVVMNGVRRGTIYDDAQQPNSEFLEEYFSDDPDGNLHKIESWFEFANDGQNQGSTYATLERVNKRNGEIDVKRYRWNWRPRATRNPDDWAPLTNLIAVVNDTGASNYEERVRAWMDIPNFLGPVIVHHVCGSWDSYAYRRGKNMYAYKPRNAPWRLLMWDIEISLGAGGDGPSTSIYTMFDSALLNMILSVPAFHREYLAGFREAVDTALAPGAADALLDERYANLQRNGVPVASPQFIKNYIASRRSYLNQILPTAPFSVANPEYEEVSGPNTLTLAGRAPLNLRTILVNGVEYPVTWVDVLDWRIVVPLNPGTNQLSITGIDRNGKPVPSASATVIARYTGPEVDPAGHVVFNEILFQPQIEGATFVEFFNTHPTHTFDLSGWRVNGLSYTFPSGTLLGPNTFLVLSQNPFTHAQAYGLARPAFDAFAGTLDRDGETLTLLRPGPGGELVVDRVRYEAGAPWGPVENGMSVQLIDATQDNSRAGNWASCPTNPPPPAVPQSIVFFDYSEPWRYMQTQNLDGVNWRALAYNDSAWPTGPGLLAFENNATLNPLINTTLEDPRFPSGPLGPGHAYYFRKIINVTNDLSDYTIVAS